MSILIDALPKTVKIGSRFFPVRTDFRIWLEFDRIMNSKESIKHKIEMVLRLCFDIENSYDIPQRIDCAMEALSMFYLCGHAHKKSTNRQKILSLSEDADYIYAAFLSEYGIDLVSVPYLHWYQFSALLKAISESSALSKIMTFRAVDPNLEKNPKRRRYLKKMKELYALEDKRTVSEMEQDIAEILSAI